MAMLYVDHAAIRDPGTFMQSNPESNTHFPGDDRQVP